jgi:hypothetical protein
MKITAKKSLDSDSIPNFLLARTSQCGGSESNGKWWNLAELFSFSNGTTIDPEAFRSLVSGWAPDRSRPLDEDAADRTVQITFRADASVSSLWATSDSRTRSEIERCHQDAVAHSLEVVEWSECAYQEPHYRRFLPTPADILGAIFHHTFNGDLPDLHSHCVIIGAARARETRNWGKLDPRPFTEHLDDGATIYQQALMDLLAARLAIASEQYAYDENGPHYRVCGGPLDWLIPDRDSAGSLTH